MTPAKASPAKRERPNTGKRKRRTHDDNATLPPAQQDDRFSAAGWDPRFARVPKRAKQAAADPRFELELRTNPAFQSTQAPVDRFGRPLHPTSPSDDDVEHPPEVKQLLPVERGELPAAAFGASDVSSDDEDDDDAFDDLDEEHLQHLAQDAQAQEDIPRGRATTRLAVIGLDWSTTRSVDIFASFACFCPPGGGLEFVEVHPSKLGLQRLADEARFGPQVIAEADLRVVQEAEQRDGAVASEHNKQSHRLHENSENSSQDEDSDDGESKREGNFGAVPDDIEVEDDSNSEDDGSLGHLDDDADSSQDDEDEEDAEAKNWREQIALRRHEEERTKYYYAVAKFINLRSADAVYEQCDGVEFAQSGRMLDLRFIPEDMEIETTARDRADVVPEGYQPPEVNLSSLNNSRVKLSWDNDEPDRVVLKKKAFGKKELNEENLKAYLADSDDDDDDDNEKSKEEQAAELERKRRLLLGGNEEDEEEDGNEEKDEDMELEIKFEPGMLEKGEEIMRRKQEREEHQDETAWERRLRKQQERKAEKRKQRRQAENGDEYNKSIADEEQKGGDADEEEPSFSDPFFSVERSFDEAAAGEDRLNAGEKEKKKKKKQNKRFNKDADDDVAADENEEAKQRKQGELELLMMDDLKTSQNGTQSMKERLAADESDDSDDGKRGRGKRSRGRRRGERSRAGGEPKPKASTVETDDARFQGLFDSHLFAMDPTHPKFKDNETTRKIMNEKGRRAKQRREGRTHAEIEPAPKQSAHSSAQNELQQLTARLKARAKAKSKTKAKRPSRKPAA